VAGSDAQVGVVFLNTGTLPERVDIPERLAVTVERGEASEGVLVRRAGEAAARTISAGAFVRVPYKLAIPAGASGRMTLTLKDPGSSPVVMMVREQGATEAPAAADAGAAAGGPATAPATSDAPTPNPLPEHSGMVEYFAKNFSGYEPTYFLMGSRPTAKFQFSFKYRIFDPAGSWAQAFPPLAALHLAYSQTSFWDLAGDSKPFVDNSYRPELLLSYDDILPESWRGKGGLNHLGFQTGFQHESNGKSGADLLPSGLENPDASRSHNILYVRPIFVFGNEEKFFLKVAPRVYAYVLDNEDSDIEDYRGYGDLRVVVGQGNGLQLAAVGRLGLDGNKGSLELDLSHPLHLVTGGNTDLFVYAQFFTGFGETLIGYKETTTTFRVGVGLVR
jgi:phospholipase A1